MKNKRSGAVPTLEIRQESLRVIDHVIEGIIPCFLLRQPVPQHLIEYLRRVREKLAPALLPGGFPPGTEMLLQPMEMWVIAIALQSFADRMLIAVEPSARRDQFIKELIALRNHFDHLLHPARRAD